MMQAQRHGSTRRKERAMLGPIILSVAMLGQLLAADPTRELMPPVRLEAASVPIDTDVGHAAPFVGDIDGDGKLDLLVGQFGEGVLWTFRNVGTHAEPKFAAGARFQAGGEDGRVPTG
jgi:hypothetical protein